MSEGDFVNGASDSGRDAQETASQEDMEEERWRPYADLPPPPPQTLRNRKLYLRDTALKQKWSKSPYYLSWEDVKDPDRLAVKKAEFMKITTVNEEHYPKELFTGSSKAKTREISRVSAESRKVGSSTSLFDTFNAKLAKAEEEEERFEMNRGVVKAEDDADHETEREPGLVRVKEEADAGGDRTLRKRESSVSGLGAGPSSPDKFGRDEEEELVQDAEEEDYSDDEYADLYGDGSEDDGYGDDGDDGEKNYY
ncbi:hypothetical protein HOP50_17g79970 [Chloropicon primus]|uniref:DNA-directed RNA polymerase III subunit n=1 Tax=Chloropicon primus TaxID=1764295 RepID=A0A5B8MY03_9CHLO|nr:hypothetical protein A3770_17p79750 [Chloropicon primus]UPR04653.1 hypothetical protein HOP50_17g79970 [Chloropicon primus]|mmetsp:Transcript_4244/g.12401  ORF Transcript_4244/g.12401 Transcript_4244/m.12401 type:complete len:253 (-) Transcript_4244:1293-2051(-)|eukprot:QDZ25457.1 hypothetical protein A3770_17p79750 [Chloropicon primus]